MTIQGASAGAISLITPQEFRRAAEDALVELDQPGLRLLTTLAVDGSVSIALGSVGKHLHVGSLARPRHSARAWLIRRLRQKLPK